MVAVSPSKTKAWLAGMRLRGPGVHAGDRLAPLSHHHGDGDPRHLGILAFEAARTMSRLVSLHRSLSDAAVARLRSDVMLSEGVAYLNSPDQAALLRLACAEMVDDLDAAAAAVARLAKRCRGEWPRVFEYVYADLKAGTGDIPRLGLGLHPKDAEKKVKKMEKYVASTSALYEAMEGLAQMESWEQRRPGKWKQWAAAGQTDVESLQKRISLQRERVRQLREESLWGRSFDKVAELMARSVVSIFARICSVYGSSVMELPQVIQGRHGRVQFAPHCHCHSRHCPPHHHANLTPGIYMSGPLERPAVGNVLARNSGPILRSPSRDAVDAKSWKKRALEPPPNTLGPSGLALRYANVVVLLDKLAGSPQVVGEETREELYWMLPDGLRAAVGMKLRCHRRMDDGGEHSEALAGGWREAVEAILGWLAPMAHATVRWHSERSFEQRQLDSETRVLMLQTLMFSDREKVEATIVELLVALSCVCRYGQGGEGGGDFLRSV